MKTNTKQMIDQLRSRYERVTSLAEEVAKAEAAILSAEVELENAEIDDGKTAPEKIVERAENARRQLAIRKIEANRLAANLEDAESRLASAAESIHPIVESELAAAYKQKFEAVESDILKIVGAHLKGYALVNNLVHATESVNIPLRMQATIHEKAHKGSLAYAKSILDASAFI
jgi:septum formation inhibitor MinC